MRFSILNKLAWIFAAMFCILAISTSAYAQTSPGRDAAARARSPNWLESLFSSILSSDKSLQMKRPTSDTGGISIKPLEKQWKPVIILDCAARCNGHGEGGVKDPQLNDRR
jgi:hypothetical protein